MRCHVCNYSYFIPATLAYRIRGDGEWRQGRDVQLTLQNQNLRGWHKISTSARQHIPSSFTRRLTQVRPAATSSTKHGRRLASKGRGRQCFPLARARNMARTKTHDFRHGSPGLLRLRRSTYAKHPACSQDALYP